MTSFDAISNILLDFESDPDNEIRVVGDYCVHETTHNSRVVALTVIIIATLGDAVVKFNEILLSKRGQTE